MHVVPLFLAWVKECLPNAAVFPLPVLARPMTSFPDKTAGMQACCTGVGLAMPRERQTLTSQSVSPRLLKFESSVGFAVETSPWLRASASLFAGTTSMSGTSAGGAVRDEGFFLFALVLENNSIPSSIVNLL